LLSALSAVGRVYVGPIAGWFVEVHGWPLFYLFSIAVAVPGLILLYICRQTLEHTQKTDEFMPRTTFKNAYRWALRLLTVGCVLLAVWLILLITNALDWTSATDVADILLLRGIQFSVVGIVLGGLLDYLALRREKLA
jgi:PAT family beta-lactamase induction signal transducer AmpG